MNLFFLLLCKFDVFGCRLGPTSLAAQSILIVSSTVTFQVPFALGIATSVRIGQLLGLAQPRLAKLTGYSAMLLAFAISFFFTTIFWVWRKQWAYLFSNDEGRFCYYFQTVVGSRTVRCRFNGGQYLANRCSFPGI